MEKQRVVLVVCQANTCRSVIAAELLKRELEREGLHRQWRVLSGGVALYARDGALVSLEARLVLRDEGIELPEGAVSTDLKQHRDWVARADLILAMTRAQLATLREDFPESHGKPVFTWKTFAGFEGDIEDPFGQPESVYRHCKDEIKLALPGVVSRLARGDFVALPG